MHLTDEQKTTAYLQRIGITVSPGYDVDADLLQKVYRAQVTTVPYENINYLLWTRRIWIRTYFSGKS